MGMKMGIKTQLWVKMGFPLSKMGKNGFSKMGNIQKRVSGKSRAEQRTVKSYPKTDHFIHRGTPHSRRKI